ncbi:MAG: hypothetical protein KAI27_05570 [Rhodospirillaceae bacterium]|nr:hypothetical protein [Rhodospirillaceae bacterium]
MLKKLLIGTGVLAIVAAGGLYLLASNIDSIVKTAVEEGGSRVTGVQVRLDKSNIDLTNQRGALMGLSVANPDGFKTPYAFNFGAIGLELGQGSTRSLLVIDKIVIDKPEITYEIGKAGSNVDAIQQNVDRFTSIASGSDEKSSGEKSSATPSDGGIKMIINDLYIRGGKINVSASLMQGKTITTNLPEIHLKDIGKKSGGADAGQVAELLIDAISKHAGGAVGALDLSKIGIKDIGAIGKTATDTLKKVGTGGADAIESGIKDVGKALDGLFK